MIDNYFMKNESTLHVKVGKGSNGIVRFTLLERVFPAITFSSKNFTMIFIGPFYLVRTKGMGIAAVMGTALLRRIQLFFGFFLADYRSTIKDRDELPKTIIGI